MMDFNNTFNNKGEKQRFIYKQNPLSEHAYQIFEFKEDKKNYEPVGEYIVLDLDEDKEVTRLKMNNLVDLLNGREDLQDLGDLTNVRLLFNVVPRQEENDLTKVIFRSFDGSGTSVENAVFMMEKGIINEGRV